MSTSTMKRVELRIDVTGSCKLPGKLEVAATAFLPDRSLLPEQPIVIFAFPGGGYARGYFDLQLPGRTGYSEAEYYTARGFIVVGFDHLGIGDSTTTHADSMRIEDMAAGNDKAVCEVIARLQAGTIDKSFPAVPKFFKVGIGQSMGGCLTLIMQGRHRTYDAIAPLGFSAIGIALAGTGGPQVTAKRSDDPAKVQIPAQLGQMTGMERLFHWEDVPREIVQEDMDGYPYRKKAPKWGTTVVPRCCVAMISPGFVAEDAAVIDVPVLMAMGERDVVPEPLKEPSAFPKARDISVYIIPRMAHMHNFASTRELMWRRVSSWARMVAQA